MHKKRRYNIRIAGLIRPIWLVCSLFPFFVVSYAQEFDYSYAHYDTHEGLAGSIVYYSVQDHDGFIWFGTETGLSRFDGTRFVRYTTADGLPDNEILKLFVDSKNRVWIIPFRNSLCYYWRGAIHNKENDPLIKQLSITNEVVSITENARSEIAILQMDKIHIIYPDGKVILMDNEGTGKMQGAYGGGLKDQHTFQFLLWSNANGYVPHLYECRQNELVLVRRISNMMPLRASVYLSPDLEIRVENDSLLFLFPKKGYSDKIPVPGGLKSINRLNDSLVALNLSSSVLIYNIFQKKIAYSFCRDLNINCTMEDREGNLWFSTMGHGIYRLASPEFMNYQFRLNGHLLPVMVVKIYGDTLYAGTDHFKLWTINLRKNILTGRQIIPEMTAGRITCLERMDDGSIIAGTDRGIRKIKGQKIVVIWGSVAVKSIQEFSGRLLVGHSSGIVVSYPVLSKPDSGILWNVRATAVYGTNDSVYFGTLDGLCVIKKGEKVFNKAGQQYKELRGRIAAIQGSPDGTLWIATSGNGVVGYKHGKIIASINEETGLTSNICRAIFVKDSTLWVGTERGLNKVAFEKGQYHITNYTTSDGLISNMINTIFVDNNTVYAGTPEGICFFDEKKVFIKSMCLLKVTDIRSNTHRWHVDTTGLHFAHYDNNIRFEFAGISFKSGGQITYHYYLKGITRKWQTTQDNYLDYQSLPSGQYELQLMAVNKFGVRSNIIHINFTIEQLLWEKTWFRIAGILFMLAVTWVLVSLRIKWIRKQEQIKLETAGKMAELEQMALKAQMNPHFIFNSLNAIQQYVIDKDVQGTNKYIADFSRLIRQTLELSSKTSITLEEEINYISTYLKLEQLRFDEKFNYYIYVADNVDIASISIPPMVLQPYIENGIRHGVRNRKDNEGLILVDFSVVENNLICVVQDNGVGRKASEKMKGSMKIEYQSKGMTLTARRIEMMNRGRGAPIYIDVQDVYGEDAIYAGTRVTIRFPFQNNTSITSQL